VQIADKTIVVTGAASGIGFAIAKSCLERGGRVVLADIEERALDQASGCLADVERMSTWVVDVRRPEGLKALREHVDATFGGADILCNNAGVMPQGAPVWETPLEDLEWVAAVNLWGIVHGVREFVPGMVERARPAYIVNTASMAGFGPAPFYAGYAMTKAAIVSLSATLHGELVATHAPIGVSVLLPEAIATRLAFAERNRGTGGEAVDEDRSRDLFRGALDPDVIGARVADAIESDRFWILPPKEDPHMQGALTWMEGMKTSAS
jgi:NAD(P)-dependent dehydrogenase (short-subunit alcohol dehydrogenase family)